MSHVVGRTPQVYCRRPGAGVPLCPDHPEAASQHHDAGGEDAQGVHSPGRAPHRGGVAQVKINGADEEMLSYAAEQFGGQCVVSHVVTSLHLSVVPLHCREGGG